MNEEALRRRFAQTAARVGARSDERAAELALQVRRFVRPHGDERALDSGAGTGALAFALAPLVREVVALELVPELIAEGERRRATHPNVTFVEGDVTRLPFDSGSFDLAGMRHVLHHVPWPEVAFAELVRVTHPGGRLLVIDQIAPVDPLAALDLDRFERARDASHARLLPDADFRHLFEANDLTLLRAEFSSERRELAPYLDLAGCEGEAQEEALRLAPGEGAYTASSGWYLVAKS